jgi:predicted ester cyclase
MSDERNAEMVHRLFQAFNERRFDDLEGTLLSPALVWRHHGQESDIRHWIRDAKDCVISFPDAKLDIETERTIADQVTVTFRLRGTHLGPFGESPPSGRSFDIPGTSTFRILDGLIVEDEEHLDEEALVQQLALT